MNRDGYRNVGAAKDVFDKYDSFEITPETPLGDAGRLASYREWWDNVAYAMESLSRCVNGGKPEELAKAMFHAVGRDHRTLQAQMFLTMLEFIDIYKDAAFDGRNECAVAAAEKISQFVKDEHIFIPLI